MNKLIVGCVAVIGLVVLAAPAAAQVTQGQMNLSLSSTFLAYRGGQYEIDGGEEEDLGELTVGLGQPHVGIGFGYTVTDGLVIGTVAALGYTKVEVDGTDTNTFLFRLLATIEYAFLTGRIRPFIGGALGLVGQTLELEVRGDNPESWWLTFALSASGGCHFFLTDSFAIDTMVYGSFLIGGGEERWGDYDENLDVIGFEVVFALGLSGWFGG